MTILKTTAMAAALVCAGSIASAATFDFGQYADDNGEGSFSSVTGGSLTVDGIMIVDIDAGLHDGVSAKEVEDAAYLDGSSGGRQGGLGVCTSGYDDDECDIASDDNTGMSGGPGSGSGLFEYLYIEFDVKVLLTGLIFRDGDHNVLDSGLLLLGDDTADSPLDLFAWNIGDALPDYASDVWIFASTADGVEFYIDELSATEVPLPAAGFLLLGGLGGLVAMKRRKKA